MLMDSATSPSVPRRMTGQKHTEKGESFQIKESNRKKSGVMCIGIGLMLYATVMD